MAGDSATIRLRIDSTGARSDLDALDRRVDQSARAAQRSMGGGGGGGGGGILSRVLGGGLGSLLGGIGIGALAGQFAAPIIGDAGKVTGGLLGTAGEAVSSFLGLRQLGANVDAARQAQQDTIQALGPAAAFTSPEGIQRLYESFLGVRKGEAAGRVAVEDATRSFIGAEAAAPFLAVLERIAKAVEGGGGAAAMSTGPTSTVPGTSR